MASSGDSAGTPSTLQFTTSSSSTPAPTRHGGHGTAAPARMTVPSQQVPGHFSDALSDLASSMESGADQDSATTSTSESGFASSVPAVGNGAGTAKPDSRRVMIDEDYIDGHHDVSFAHFKGRMSGATSSPRSSASSTLPRASRHGGAYSKLKSRKTQ